jgi:hypothetical protein
MEYGIGGGETSGFLHFLPSPRSVSAALHYRNERAIVGRVDRLMVWAKISTAWTNAATEFDKLALLECLE